MLSRTRVTGPSFSKDTFISALELPCSIFNPDLAISDLKYSNKGMAFSGFAALYKMVCCLFVIEIKVNWLDA